MTTLRHGGLFPLLLLAAAPGTSGCVEVITGLAEQAQGSFERSLTVSGPVDLEVSTGSGSIDVRPGSDAVLRIQGTVRVHSRKVSRARAEEKVRALEANPPIEQSGSIIRIGRIENRELREDVSISYELVVPRETRLRARTGSGSQTVEGIRGPADVDTGSGSLRVSGIEDEIKARTGSGSIHIEDARGPVQASTGSGSIHGSRLTRGIQARTGSGEVSVDQCEGDVEAGTGSGSIRVQGLRGSLRAHTGSGNIVADGDPAGEWNLDASSGSVTIRLPAEAAFDLDARAGSGSVSLGHPVTIQGTVRPNELRGKVRGGGSLLYVRTGSGRIEIE